MEGALHIFDIFPTSHRVTDRQWTTMSNVGTDTDLATLVPLRYCHPTSAFVVVSKGALGRWCETSHAMRCST